MCSVTWDAQYGHLQNGQYTSTWRSRGARIHSAVSRPAGDMGFLNSLIKLVHYIEVFI